MVGRHESSSQLKPVCHLNVIYLSRCAPRHRTFSRWNWWCEASAPPASPAAVRCIRSERFSICGPFIRAASNSLPAVSAQVRCPRLSPMTAPAFLENDQAVLNLRHKPNERQICARHCPSGAAAAFTQIDLADMTLRTPLRSIHTVAGLATHRLFPRRARPVGGEPSH